MTIEDIKKHLTTTEFGKKIYAFESIDTTNTYAKTLALQGSNEGTLVIADDQLRGRGRLGRTWFSEKGKNLTFSFIVKPNIPPQSIGVLSLYAGVSVAAAIREVTGITPECKWPNDVFINGKKVCGILSEGIFTQDKLSAVVIGIGLNVNQSEFPSEIRETATSLMLAAGKVFDRFQVLATVLEHLESLYDNIQSNRINKILSLWNRYNRMFGKYISVSYQNTVIRGIAKQLADDGGLIIQVNRDEQKVMAADVTIIKE
ncbi:MAG: biotin--[acetyl-CoA-carboxylase] ligase [Ignavibacteriae bacterium]|nr:biotin--[acetyl-CoA-carboxylase] ligase [Ignavibacteriota bacterium]